MNENLEILRLALRKWSIKGSNSIADSPNAPWGNVASDIFSRRITFLKMSSIHQASKNTSGLQCHKLGMNWKVDKKKGKIAVWSPCHRKVFLPNSNSRPRSKQGGLARWLGWSWEYHLGQYSYTYTTKTFDTLGEVVYDCTTHGKCTCGAAAPQNPFLLWQIGDHFCDMFSSTNEKRVSWYIHNSQNMICTRNFYNMISNMTSLL